VTHLHDMNQIQQLVYYFNEGGLLMWPLLVCSIVAVAVIIERAVRLRRSRLIDPAVVERIQTQIEEGQLDKAIAENRNSPSLVGQILSRGLEEYTSTSADIETSLTEAGERGLQVLHNNMAVLNVVAKVAPLLGLLGTVQGMIMGFEHLELKGVGKEDLAHAIRVALITTFAGLSIAIPTVVAAAYFRSRIRRLLAEFEEIFIDVIKTVKSARPPRTPEPKTELAAGRSTP
jgi:biopolymer transport protein ExbB